MALKPFHRAPKHHFKAARLGDHFLSERPEKCVPMAGGAIVASMNTRKTRRLARHTGLKRRSPQQSCDVRLARPTQHIGQAET